MSALPKPGQKWDPQKQEWVDRYPEPAEEQPRRGAGVVIGAVVALFLASVFVVLAVNAGEVESEAAARPTRALPTPSPALPPTSGDLPVGKGFADGLSESLLRGYLFGGPAQTEFVRLDVERRTGCRVSATIERGMPRAELRDNVREMKQLYPNDRVGSARVSGWAIYTVVDCP